MTTLAKCLLESKYAENAQTTQYTAGTGVRTIIDKFTGYSPAGGTLAAGETYTFPEVVGQILNAGDFVSTLAAAASSVVIRISGREIT